MSAGEWHTLSARVWLPEGATPKSDAEFIIGRALHEALGARFLDEIYVFQDRQRPTAAGDAL